MKLLLLSNSTNPGEGYLGWPRELLARFVQENGINSCFFVPYAGVTVAWDDYADKVAGVFAQLGCPKLVSAHRATDPLAEAQAAACIVVGGGNTFRLVQLLHQTGLMAVIRQKAQSGTPFIGWSAGSNLACPTLRTTNDMPIVEPASFEALGLLPFQINPHYLDAHPDGHGGETRQQRIEEFLALNPSVAVAGLREASALAVQNDKIVLLGERSLRLFRHGLEPVELLPGDVTGPLLAITA